MNDPNWVESFNAERRQQSRAINTPVIKIVTATGVIPVKHDLGRVPTEFHVVDTDVAVNISRDVKAWDDTYAYINASAANAVVSLRFR